MSGVRSKLFRFEDKVTERSMGMLFALCPRHEQLQKVPEGLRLRHVEGIAHTCDECVPNPLGYISNWRAY